MCADSVALLAARYKQHSAESKWRPRLITDLTTRLALFTKQVTSIKEVSCREAYPLLFPYSMLPITVHDYIMRIARYTNCSCASLVIGYIYLRRFLSAHVQFELNQFSIHRLLLISLVQAIKLNEDDHYNNKMMARIGGEELADLNALELSFVFELRFNFVVTDTQFYDALCEITAHVPMRQEFLPSPDGWHVHWQHWANDQTDSTGATTTATAAASMAPASDTNECTTVVAANTTDANSLVVAAASSMCAADTCSSSTCAGHVPPASARAVPCSLSSSPCSAVQRRPRSSACLPLPLPPPALEMLVEAVPADTCVAMETYSSTMAPSSSTCSAMTVDPRPPSRASCCSGTEHMRGVHVPAEDSVSLAGAAAELDHMGLNTCSPTAANTISCCPQVVQAPATLAASAIMQYENSAAGSFSSAAAQSQVVAPPGGAHVHMPLPLPLLPSLSYPSTADIAHVMAPRTRLSTSGCQRPVSACEQLLLAMAGHAKSDAPGPAPVAVHVLPVPPQSRAAALPSCECGGRGVCAACIAAAAAACVAAVQQPPANWSQQHNSDTATTTRRLDQPQPQQRAHVPCSAAGCGSEGAGAAGMCAHVHPALQWTPSASPASVALSPTCALTSSSSVPHSRLASPFTSPPPAAATLASGTSNVTVTGTCPTTVHVPLPAVTTQTAHRRSLIAAIAANAPAALGTRRARDLAAMLVDAAALSCGNSSSSSGRAHAQPRVSGSPHAPVFEPPPQTVLAKKSRLQAPPCDTHVTTTAHVPGSLTTSIVNNTTAPALCANLAAHTSGNVNDMSIFSAAGRSSRTHITLPPCLHVSAAATACTSTWSPPVFTGAGADLNLNGSSEQQQRCCVFPTAQPARAQQNLNWQHVPSGGGLSSEMISDALLVHAAGSGCGGGAVISSSTSSSSGNSTVACSSSAPSAQLRHTNISGHRSQLSWPNHPHMWHEQNQNEQLPATECSVTAAAAASTCSSATVLPTTATGGATAGGMCAFFSWLVGRDAAAAHSQHVIAPPGCTTGLPHVPAAAPAPLEPPLLPGAFSYAMCSSA